MRALRIAVNVALATLLVFAQVGVAAAQGRTVGLVRDAEIESLVRDYAAPIFAAAGLAADNVSVHLVQDSTLNAFVSGGQRVFVNTGLLQVAESPGEIIGVIAHETGHVAGGHLVRLRDALNKASVQTIASAVVSILAGIAAGPQVASAIAAGGQQLALNGVLSYTQAQEASADAAGLSFLDRTGQSAQGMLTMLKRLQRIEATSLGPPPGLVRTHPPTQSRIATVRNHMAFSRFTNVKPPAELQYRHDRMRAKLAGFLLPFDEVLRIYPEINVSEPARYARAVALFRRGSLAPALELIDGLIADRPDDPFYRELKGQMLFENGRIEAAIAPYRKAVALAPAEPLIRLELARVLIETGDDGVLGEAGDALEAVLRAEAGNAEAWRLLAIVRGRNGDFGKMSLAQAELALLRGNNDDALAQADKAEQLLPVGSPGWLRAQDISQLADQRKSRR